MLWVVVTIMLMKQSNIFENLKSCWCYYLQIEQQGFTFATPKLSNYLRMQEIDIKWYFETIMILNWARKYIITKETLWQPTASQWTIIYRVKCFITLLMQWINLQKLSQKQVDRACPIMSSGICKSGISMRIESPAELW